MPALPDKDEKASHKTAGMHHEADISADPSPVPWSHPTPGTEQTHFP